MSDTEGGRPAWEGRHGEYTDAGTGNPLASVSKNSESSNDADTRTAWDKIADFFGAVYHNIDLTAGIGQGLYLGFSLFDDAVGLGIGGYGNYGSFILNHGETLTCQEGCIEFVVEFALMEFGASKHMYFKKGETIIDDSWAGYNDKSDRLSVFSLRAYALFLGFSFDLGFNYGGFITELSEVF